MKAKQKLNRETAAKKQENDASLPRRSWKEGRGDDSSGETLEKEKVGERGSESQISSATSADSIPSIGICAQFD